MSTPGTQSVSSALFHVFVDKPEGVAAADLIDAVIRDGFTPEDVVRAVRQMLDSGKLGLTAEMHICLQKQLA